MLLLRLIFVIWDALGIHFGTSGYHFGTWWHPGGLTVGAAGRTPGDMESGFVDFVLILGPHFESFLGSEAQNSV